MPVGAVSRSQIVQAQVDPFGAFIVIEGAKNVKLVKGYTLSGILGALLNEEKIPAPPAGERNGGVNLPFTPSKRRTQYQLTDLLVRTPPLRLLLEMEKEGLEIEAEIGYVARLKASGEIYLSEPIGQIGKMQKAGVKFYELRISPLLHQIQFQQPIRLSPGESFELEITGFFRIISLSESPAEGNLLFLLKPTGIGPWTYSATILYEQEFEKRN
jgi:hypothetical protein